MGQTPNSPLIEAIFELRWGQDNRGHFSFDRNETDFFPGQFKEAISAAGYPNTEIIQTEEGRPTFPFEVKYRFRKEPNTWPCTQLGLGLLTTNQLGNFSSDLTGKDGYDWDTFKPEIETALSVLDRTFPGGIKALRGPKASLRYQDGFVLGSGESFEDVIRDKIKVKAALHGGFTNHENIRNETSSIQLSFQYESTKPKGSIFINVSSALIRGKKGIVIETHVMTDFSSQSLSKDDLLDWAEEAHDLQRHSFKTLIIEENLGADT